MAARTPIPTGTPDESRTRASGWQSAGWGWIAAIVVAIIAIVVVGALILIDDDAADDALPALGATSSSVSEIVGDPDALLDERVTTSGRVEELLTDRAFAIGSDLATGSVLVLMDPASTVAGYGIGAPGVAPLPAGEVYDEGDVVQVTGTIREFDRDALSDELGLVLNDEIFDRWEGNPALVIERLDVATVGGRPTVIETAPPA